nr:MAG TPA: hypothetical protein [Caudoviricetes sp.]
MQINLKLQMFSPFSWVYYILNFKFQHLVSTPSKVVNP